MKAILTLILLFVFKISFTQISYSTIKGRIDGLTNDTIKITLLKIDTKEILHQTRIPTKRGEFFAKIPITEFCDVNISSNKMAFSKPDGNIFFMRSKSISFFLDKNQQINIKGKISTLSIDSLTIVGSTLSKQESSFRSLNGNILTDETRYFLQVLKLKANNAPKKEIDSFNSLLQH